MEAKRSNLQTLQKPQTSKTQVLKTASEVSLTPSQAAEQAKINARKNPLDALSRLSLRHQAVEKRSGLQDVDDEYFKKNVFSRSGLAKHSGLNDVYGARNQIQTQNISQPVSSSPNDVTHIQPQQQQQSHQQQQQQLSSPQILTQNQSQIPSQQQPQVQITSQQQQISPSQPSSQLQCKNQSYKEPHSPQSAPTPHHNYYHQQSQGVPANEPELCTTCPNCQTTIYLVRGHETNSEPAPVYTSTNHDNVISAPTN